VYCCVVRPSIGFIRCSGGKRNREPRSHVYFREVSSDPCALQSESNYGTPTSDVNGDGDIPAGNGVEESAQENLNQAATHYGDEVVDAESSSVSESAPTQGSGVVKEESSRDAETVSDDVGTSAEESASQVPQADSSERVYPEDMEAPQLHAEEQLQAEEQQLAEEQVPQLTEQQGEHEQEHPQDDLAVPEIQASDAAQTEPGAIDSSDVASATPSHEQSVADAAVPPPPEATLASPSADVEAAVSVPDDKADSPSPPEPAPDSGDSEPLAPIPARPSPLAVRCRMCGAVVTSTSNHLAGLALPVAGRVVGSKREPGLPGPADDASAGEGGGLIHEFSLSGSTVDVALFSAVKHAPLQTPPHGTDAAPFIEVSI
jgi:hypothetical protein